LQKINALPGQASPSQTNTLELKDIHIPEQISNLPIAYGWWILAALLILILVITIIKIRRSAKRNQLKKQALLQLTNNPKMTISDTVAILKWAAMHYFSRTEIAKLFGSSLQSFLTSKLPANHQKKFTDLSEQGFINQYQAQGNENSNEQADENLHQAATLWLTYALPPKASNNINGKYNAAENNEHGVTS